MENTWVAKTFNLKYPIILAPMFLVSNNEMLKAAAKAGITGCIPALNFRELDDLEKGLKDLKENCPGPFGINLIVNSSNIKAAKQIEILKQYPPDYIITSLGSPGLAIKELQPLGTKIICDVTDLSYAQKVKDQGADALIAVNNGAGGHAGKIPASVLVPRLIDEVKLPVISAGGIGEGRGLLSMMALGAQGVSIGSPFIASKECQVSKEYKQACLDYGAKDIVLTKKISGSPCTVINTPYVQKIGTDENIVEKTLNKNRSLKKWVRMMTYYKGMKAVQNAAFQATYKTVWCAGPSIEFSNVEKSVEEIVKDLIDSYEVAKSNFMQI